MATNSQDDATDAKDDDDTDYEDLAHEQYDDAIADLQDQHGSGTVFLKRNQNNGQGAVSEGPYAHLITGSGADREWHYLGVVGGSGGGRGAGGETVDEEDGIEEWSFQDLNTRKIFDELGEVFDPRFEELRNRDDVKKVEERYGEVKIEFDNQEDVTISVGNRFNDEFSVSFDNWGNELPPRWRREGLQFEGVTTPKDVKDMFDDIRRKYGVRNTLKENKKKYNKLITAFEEGRLDDDYAEEVNETFKHGTGEEFRQAINDGISHAQPAPDITVGEIVETEHGEQFALDSPYEAKDDIKDLDWEETHRTWDSDRKAWLVDADSVDEVSRELEEAGWEVDETDD